MRVNKLFTAFAVILCLILLSANVIATAGTTINEIRIDQPSIDTDEYLEIVGTPGTSLDGLTYLVIGDGSGGSGVIEAVVDLTGYSIQSSGFFVAAEGTFSLGTSDLTTSLNFENSDNVNHYLVNGFTGSKGDDLDTDDDGTLDVTPWSGIVDCVGLVETSGSGDLIYCTTIIGPDGSNVPFHVFKCTDGWKIGQSNPTGGDDTPGSENNCPSPPTSSTTTSSTTTSTSTSTSTSTTTTLTPPPSSEIPEYPTAALPAGIAAMGYLILQKRKRRF